MEYLTYKDRYSMHSVADMERGSNEIRAVFRTLKKHISSGEFKNMESVLPSQLKKMLRESSDNNKPQLKLIKNENTVSSN